MNGLSPHRNETFATPRCANPHLALAVVHRLHAKGIDMPTNQNQRNQQNQKRDAQQKDRDDMRKTANRDQDQDRSGKQAPKQDQNR